MSLRKSPRMTPARLAANRLSAKKSTGPRTLQGKQRSAMNAFKSGLWSRSFRRVLTLAGDPVWKFDGVIERLSLLLKPRNRLQAARLVRYAQMLWSVHWRAQRALSPRVSRRRKWQLSPGERVHHKRVMKDMEMARGRTRAEGRRKAEPFMRLIRYLDRMVKSAEIKLKNEERSLNVL
jgi:hypothetical protein